MALTVDPQGSWKLCSILCCLLLPTRIASGTSWTLPLVTHNCRGRGGSGARMDEEGPFLALEKRGTEMRRRHGEGNSGPPPVIGPQRPTWLDAEHQTVEFSSTSSTDSGRDLAGSLQRKSRLKRDKKKKKKGQQDRPREKRKRH